MDITFPLMELTGRERSLHEFSQPDERILRSRLTIEQLQAPYLTIEADLSTSTPEKLRERIIVTRELAIYGYFVYEFHAVSMLWAVSCIEMALIMKFAERCPDPITVSRKAADGSEETCQIPVGDLQPYRREKWRMSGVRKDFDHSFRALLSWAFDEKLLPENIPIPIQEVVALAENEFLLKKFPKRAAKDGLLKSHPTYDEILDCWDSLTEAQRNSYRPKPSTVLVEELPRFRNMMAHPQFNLVVFPNAPVGTYKLLVDIVARLWT